MSTKYQKLLTTINDGIVKYQENDHITIHKQEVLNETKWVFAGNDETEVENFVSDFLKNNNRLISGIDEMPIEKLLVNELHKKKLTISFAESCTGGMLASTIVNVSGASYVFNQSFVTYSEEAKIKFLDVSKNLIKKHTVYSPEVAEAMAEGLYAKTKADFCISVTGHAGGEETSPEDGVCYFAILNHAKEEDYLQLEKYQVRGARNEVRRMQTTYILWKVLQLVKGLKH